MRSLDEKDHTARRRVTLQSASGHRWRVYRAVRPSDVASYEAILYGMYPALRGCVIATRVYPAPIRCFPVRCLKPTRPEHWQYTRCCECRAVLKGTRSVRACMVIVSGVNTVTEPPVIGWHVGVSCCADTLSLGPLHLVGFPILLQAELDRNVKHAIRAVRVHRECRLCGRGIVNYQSPSGYCIECTTQSWDGLYETLQADAKRAESTVAVEGIRSFVYSLRRVGCQPFQYAHRQGAWTLPREPQEE